VLGLWAVFFGVLAAAMPSATYAVRSPAEVVPSGPPVVRYAPLAYPEAARKARMQGFAVVDLMIAPDGSGEIISSQGTNPLLVGAAERAAVLFRFQAQDGRVVRCATVLFRFELSGPPSESTPEVKVLSPHEVVVVATPPPPLPTWGCRLPPSRPAFVSFGVGSTTIGEGALRLLPLE
jgi:hypothetical protein